MSGNTYPFGWVGPLYGLDIGNATSIQGAGVEPSPTNDDILQYNAGNNKWENKNIGEIIGITGSDNQVMRYDADTGFIQNSNLIITDTDNLTGVNTLQLNQLDGPAAGITTAADIDAGANKVKSTAVPVANDDLVNKLYIDGEVADKVVGPASVAANRICVFDGTTGKLIKQEGFGINGGILNAYDGIGNPTTILFGNDLSMLNNDITQVNEINVDTISSTAGGVVEFTDRPTSTIAPVNGGDLTNKLYVDNLVGNFYAMLTDGPTVSDGDPETSLLPSGVGDFVGTLTVPANGFAVGDSFHFVLAGQCIYDTANDITLKLKNGGILAELTMNLENTDAPNTYWELEADFTIRSIGVSGSIVINFDFTFNKRLDKDFKGQRNVSVSTINTTISNTLDITAEFTGTATSSMFAQLGYLKKMH